ncbi:iron dicitrate transport regulator FecR [Ramlibacter rhizophilus]|uniref:Iron dicitrate transport regulator FecR n=1 Tax=Ramlibacter rhizophilus TaxID=1781167 RepID=A0A4Z0BF19_9BURK|nr:iron dicitrate transport regulator FecR [Ramlibacter rhizophilus]TFY96907.1 iron dicitrate transport regulator FecR [Ramlibacter rhizophilus]
MTRHRLQGRTEAEVLWFQRRSFLRAAAAWSALGGWAGAQAQARGNIVELQGAALLNGQPLRPTDTVQTGDVVQTGPGSTLIFVIGNTACHLRQDTLLQLRRGETLNTVSLLRLVTGGVASVWGPGQRRLIVTPTLTAGIRGTGVYTEVPPGEDRSYFCNCYGTVDLTAGADQTVSTAQYHEAFWGEPAAARGRALRPAPELNHTDEELEFLARLLGQRTAWQVAGRKPAKGSAY